jgi:ATP-dependent RNA helicase DDX24/MAK5
MTGLRFFVIDEADRMIENGHFAELDQIVRLTSRPESCVSQHFGHLDCKLNAHSSEASSGNDNGAETSAIRDKMQTFVFSATMSKDLQRNLKRFKKSKPKSIKGSTIGEQKIDRLSRMTF